MSSGMAMTADQAEIIDLQRHGTHGWKFTAVWRMGTPGELRRNFRTSGSGRGLQREATSNMPVQWYPVRGMNPRQLWSRQRSQFIKQMRILFHSSPYFDPSK